ncbi:IS66 family insertion sequence element accessory protein TnpA [Clostridium sp.]|uniref:IS66 family insertion sequence element accessory protein TnpA n=1 Tax=Clostridium sp. TaxID=1506 RepID=UPI003D6CBBCF
MSRTKVSYIWEQRVADFKASGQTATMWCESKKIRPATLRYWIRVFKPNNTVTEKSTSWISVDTSELKVISKEQPLIVNIGNASMEINSDFNKNLFLKVTELLLSLC